MNRYRLTVRGIVQGVGFRPFIYRLAVEPGLTGWVANTGSGVEIEIQGNRELTAVFLEKINSPPPLAQIDSIQVEPIQQVSGEVDFVIGNSDGTGSDPGSLPPDADVCPSCLQELFDSKSPRYLYPFINCTDCGPRYTVIENIPYDRACTTMKSFQLCVFCQAEYNEPTDRRFHAQTNCCSQCGPHYRLHDKEARQIDEAALDVDAIDQAAKLLQKGKIVAIKGIGGFHLVADACNDQALALLRERKKRPDKPLAVMAPSTEEISRWAQVSQMELELLTSPQKPIVLLRKKELYPLAPEVAPGTIFIGAMLPYTPLHYLLFRKISFKALVMTSGNIAGSPIIRDNDDAFRRLRAIADYFLVHDRDIIISNDDSVVRREEGAFTMMRRSRSYAPAGICLGEEVGKTLAFGAMLKNTVCLTRGKSAYFGHHIGDLEHPDTVAYLKKSIEHLQKSLRIDPDLVVHDLHPEYPSTILAREYAEKNSIPLIAIQHHHAHAVSCMAEHSLKGPVIAVVLDGNGWGSDSTVWGGEVLIATADSFRRIGHLLPVAMPGGDAVVYHPWRMALSYLYRVYGDKVRELDLPLIHRYEKQLPLLLQLLEKDFNSPLTSSCGRLFDALAALLNLCTESSFEGQAASKIEMNARAGVKSFYPRTLESSELNILDTGFLFQEIVEDIQGGVEAAIICARFQQTLARFFTQLCENARLEEGLKDVVLSGGVFQNLSFRNILQSHLDSRNFRVYTQEKVPPGDGGIALGQAVAGRAIYHKKQ